MATSNTERRLALFARYSANLGLVCPDHQGLYACPLCLQCFSIGDVQGDPPRLTLEDIIPKGLGANIYGLTCAQCNNTAGGQIDGHLHAEIELKSLLSGTLKGSGKKKKKSLETKLSFGPESEKPTRVTVGVTGFDPDTRTIHAAYKKQSGADPIPDRVKAWLNSKKPVRLELGGDNIRGRIAALKAGYLLAFAKFGFSWALSPLLDDVRSTIRNPAEPKVPLHSIVCRVPFQESPQNMFIVRDPNELQGLIVPVRFTNFRCTLAAVLPVNSQTYPEWSKVAPKQGDNTVELSFDGDFFSDKDIFLDQILARIHPMEGLQFKSLPSDNRELSDD